MRRFLGACKREKNGGHVFEAFIPEWHLNISDNSLIDLDRRLRMLDREAVPYKCCVNIIIIAPHNRLFSLVKSLV